MTEPIDYGSVASLLGADTVSRSLHDNSRKSLTDLLEKQPAISVPDFKSPIEHKIYEDTRSQIVFSSTLAALSGNNYLFGLIKQFVQLQQGYAKQVIKEIQTGVRDQKGLLELANKELTEGEPFRKKFEELRGMTVAQLGSKGLEEYHQLEKRIENLNKTLEEKNKLDKAIEGVSRVETTLTSLIESGIQSIHYIIPSVATIQERLGKDLYNGPDFSPFLISNTVIVNDIFMRTKTINPSVSSKRIEGLDDLPLVLNELLKIYDYIRTYPNGKTIAPNKIVKELELKNLQAKGIGSYLEDNASVFGLEKLDVSGSRTFTRKESGARLDRGNFLAYILDGKLQGSDAKEVNEFYFQKTLLLLREQPDGYLGFTKERLQKVSEQNKLPVTNTYSARNLHKRTDLGLELVEGTTDRYRFSEIIPTERQLQYVREAVDQFGINRFTPSEAFTKVNDLHKDGRVIQKVVSKILETRYDKFNLRVASNDPLQYQKTGTLEAKPASGRAITIPLM